MSDREWLSAEMADAYTSEHEPPHRIQRHALPESIPVIAAARARRLTWLEAMRAVSNSGLSEHEREAQQEIELDNAELQE